MRDPTGMEFLIASFIIGAGGFVIFVALLWFLHSLGMFGG